jgi:predicted dehydrogenase
MSRNDLTRRAWIIGTGSGTAATLAPLAAARGGGLAQSGRALRLAQIGTGGRGLHWASDIVRNYSGVVQIVGLCDINPKRVEVAKELAGSSAPTFVEFDRMIAETRPDVVLITTVDSSHAGYIIRAMELGVDVITEKPIATDERQCQAILDAEKKFGRKLTVAFNARHYPQAKKVKQLILDGAIGNVISVDYQEYLDTSHGASYFRRWHRIKEQSGTLLVSKSCHHFDQVNWWAASNPVEVMAWGDLRFYGRNSPYRGTHCRGCAYRQRCPFYWDVTKNEQSMKLYVNCESEDGYQIDGCVWRQDCNIYDTYSVMTKYENGVRLTYTANTFMPYEGQEIAINGTKGRIDFNMYDAPGFNDHSLRLTRNFGKSEVVTVDERAGGHGGADPGVRDLIFRGGDRADDPLGLKAGSVAGVYSSMVGITAYHSIERNGDRLKIADLIKI